MSAYVTPGEVAVRLRRSTPSDIGGDGYVLMVIASVESAITSWAKRVHGVGLGELPQDDLAQAVLDVTARVILSELSTADGAVQRSVAVDDVTVSKRFDRAVNLDDLLASWWARLSPVGGDAQGAFSIRPSYAPDSWPVPFPGRRGW